MSDFSVAAIFSSHMVLQRNKPVCFFGTGKDGLIVTVSLFASNKNLIAKNNTLVSKGRWEITLPPQSAQNNCTVIVSAGTAAGSDNNGSFTFTDVALGEVWLAGGQSNMEFELHNCTEGPAELNDKNNKPNVRFYYTNKISWIDEKFYEAERNTSWQTWESENKTAWSAVGYFFAKKLSQDLDCTVGIIGCNWGGTSASAWMRKEFLEKDLELCTYLTEQEEAVKGKSVQQQCEEYDNYVIENDKWQKKCDELYATVPDMTWEEVQKRIGPALWPGPHACKNPYRPSGLYECMLSRIIPYTLKGVIWYQGESDDHKPQMYYKLFANMIDNWRTDWHDNSLPFVFVQLPVNRYQQDKDFKHWCFIREAQEKIHKTIKNTWMTVAFDLGVSNDIHPKSKKILAERMEQNALCNVYNRLPQEKAMAPELCCSYITNPNSPNDFGNITLVFKNAEDGFEYRNNEEILENYKKLEEIQGNSLPEDFTGFEIAGADGVYYPAQFAFGGTDGLLNTIILCNPKIHEPKFARYCWYNYGPAAVYGKNGLPLAPFRTSTDDSQTATEHAEIQQIMTV